MTSPMRGYSEHDGDNMLDLIIDSILLGVGLAMDAFSVSLANGLNEPHMRRRKICGIAGVFAVFQGIMPIIGWGCIHTIARLFAAFEKAVPWIALILLLFLGGKMVIEGIKGGEEEYHLGKRTLLVQGVATSIDALAVGFAIADYDIVNAAVCSSVIAAVTFVICLCGVVLGRKFGTHLAGGASVVGGIILIAIGLKIFFAG